MSQPIRIAVSKGRIMESTLPLLAGAGIQPEADPETCRKLILPTSRDDVELVIVRATDVPTYVEHGAVDAGVAGKDVLMEFGRGRVYEPLDLGIARCRLMVAARKGDAKQSFNGMRVATKYVNVAQGFFSAQGIQIEAIKLYGSMELAPLVGLADRIVDVVDTGGTLRANGLEATELIASVSARLVVNKASMMSRRQLMLPLIASLANQVQGAGHEQNAA